MTPAGAEAERNSNSVMGNKNYSKKMEIITEEQRQKAKEDAVLLALQNDMALIRRDLEIYGMKKDASTVFISKSTDYDYLWQDALDALKTKFG